MSIRINKLPRWAWGLSVLILIAIAGGATANYWLPFAKRQVSKFVSDTNSKSAEDDHAHDDEHDPNHKGHAEESSIELSPAGLKNIGYRPMTVQLGTYVRKLDVPAMVVERPGRTQIQISAPLTGIVTKIHYVQGAAVAEASPLFEIRLTHEELVTAQSNLIRTAESLEVVKREIDRLKNIEQGVIAGRRILEQEYELQKLQASLTAERQALLLHGLTEEQIEAILTNRKLFKTITVQAPAHVDDSDDCASEHLYHVQSLPVNVGQQVQAGEVLGVLADHCQLYIEGRAFEDDAPQLRNAAREGLDVSASLVVGTKEADRIDGLRVLYVADHIDTDSRAFRFYLTLPNEIALDQTAPNGAPRFIEWRFKPGQRMEVHVPVERWQDRIVLPAEAVVFEGAEAYVFQQNGDHFDRIAVHVEYRDRESVVVANDGAIFPGDILAARGAFDMQLTLKKQAGGGIDPHHGHSH